MTFGSVRQCVCAYFGKCECVELPFYLQICKTRKKSAKNVCMANQSKLQQQERKAQKKASKRYKRYKKEYMI